jgi:hypothetical protein
MRADAPVRNQTLVARWVCGYIFAGTMRYPLKNAQDSIGISDIDH